jgi:hypothetical protein
MVDDENLAVILVNLLQSPSQVVLEHAVWVMDNLVLDYGHCRKRVLEAGFLDKLDPVSSMKHNIYIIIVIIIFFINRQIIFV